MGAYDFINRSSGKSAQEAFSRAVDQAAWENGHGGYTGTIAEKHAFVMIDVPAGVEPEAYANRLLQEGDPRINDKWGPAGCIALGGDHYLFFGLASS